MRGSNRQYGTDRMRKVLVPVIDLLPQRLISLAAD
jgi:hypothetical protein